MTNKKRLKVTKQKKVNDSQLFAFIATFLSIVGFFLAVLFKRKDKYVMHYAKQSLVVFFVFIVAWAVLIVPLIGIVLSPIVYVVGVILWIVSWVYALTGKIKVVPIIGQYADRIDL
jgi:uncharacterized membrane protein